MKYRVYTDGVPAAVRETEVFPKPYNRRERQEFVTLTCPENGCELAVETDTAAGDPVIRPLSLGLKAVAVNPKRVIIKVPGPCNFSLEFGGAIVGNLLVFLSPEREDRPGPSDPDVIFYGSGEHDVGTLYLSKDNAVVYLEEGAVFRGKMRIFDCRNVTVCGTGRIDDERADKRGVTLDISGCENVTVRDICITHPTTWTVRPYASENVRIENVKIIGCGGNSDGVDVVNSRRVLVENLFTRTWDDSLVVKAFGESDRARQEGAPWTDEQYERVWAKAGDVYDLTFRHCTLWNDFARPMEIGVELRTSEVRDILFKDIDVIHSTTGYPIMGCHHGDRADVHDIVFEDIRVEDAPGAQLFDFRITDSVWNTDKRKGRIHDVAVRNVDLLTPPGEAFMPSMSRLEGWSRENGVSDFRFENIRIMGRWAGSAEALGLSVRDHAENVSVVCLRDGPMIRPVAGTVEISSPFEADEDGRLRGRLRLTAENRSPERAKGAVRLSVAPRNTAPAAPEMGYDLAPGERISAEYELVLQPGRYLVSAAGDSPDLIPGWLLLTLGGRRAGFAASFSNYYGDEPGDVRISVRDGILIIDPDLRSDCTGLTLYAANRPETRPNEVLFTAEETDFGECGAVINGPHGPEPAPQLRCPAEITYVFKNEPKTGKISQTELPAHGRSEIPLSGLVSDPDAPLLIELAVRFPGSEKYRYPCTLFHSVIPASSAHMFAQIP